MKTLLCCEPQIIALINFGKKLCIIIDNSFLTAINYFNVYNFHFIDSIVLFYFQVALKSRDLPVKLKKKRTKKLKKVGNLKYSNRNLKKDYKGNRYKRNM